MSTPFKPVSVATLLVAIAAFSSGDAIAQCSGGGGGGPGGRGFSPGGSNTAFFAGSVPAANGQSLQQQFAARQMFAARQQMLRQQQLIAMRQRASQQRSQELLAARRQRAEQTRQARAERIAALRAKNGIPTSIDESTERYASRSTPSTTLTSLNTISLLD